MEMLSPVTNRSSERNADMAEVSIRESCEGGFEPRYSGVSLYLLPTGTGLSPASSLSLG